MVISVYSSVLYQENWLPRYNWNIVESGVKHHKPINDNENSIEHALKIRVGRPSGKTQVTDISNIFTMLYSRIYMLDLTEILLKVALNTINHNLNLSW
jgi:hypothetical protein